MNNQLLSGKRRIFNVLRMEKSVSRAELAKRCDLTRPAVSSIIDEMEMDGLVREIGRGASSGGKPPILLALAPSSRCAVGIDLGDDYIIRGVLCDVAGNVLDEKIMEYENTFENIAGVIYLIAKFLVRNLRKENFTGIGIAVSGVVNASRDEVTGASTLDLVGKGLAKKLHERTGMKILLEKRPNAAALAESLFGAGRIYDNLVYLTSGRGVGAGIVINGTIYRGFTGKAGEIGRILLGDGSALEEKTRPSVMLEEFTRRKNSAKLLPFRALADSYLQNDPDARSIVEQNAVNMAYAAKSAANFFDPQALILGGPVLEFGKSYFECFKKAFEADSNSCKAVPSKFGGAGVAVGGAQVVLDTLIK